MPNCPDYLSAPTPSVRKSRETKLQDREQNEFASAIRISAEEYKKKQQQNHCENLQQIKEKFTVKAPWKLLENEHGIYICTMNNLRSAGPTISSAVCIENDLTLTTYVKSVKLTTLGKYRFPMKVDSLLDIAGICDELSSLVSDQNPNLAPNQLDIDFILRLNLILSLLIPLQDDSFKFCNIIKFVYEQLHLLTKEKKCYSYDFLLFSSLLYNVSPHAFRFLRSSGSIILPCYTTIRKITLSSSMSPSIEQTDKTFLFYIKQKFQCLKSSDLTVMLLIDEIHLKRYFDYKGGTIVGSSYNNVCNAVKSAFAFMISSVFSKYKDVVHLLPTCKISADDLNAMLKKIIIGLEDIGFKVIAVITDNNAINRKAMSYFVTPQKLSIVYPHPCNHTRPLFFLFDTVHLLKCLRNNWVNIKSAEKCFAFPRFAFDNIVTSAAEESAFASFCSLKYLHTAECNSIVKFAYKLSYKALNPSTFERQNVKLVLQIFNNFTSEALALLGKELQIPHYENTSAFIKIIATWWSIVNVKTPSKGTRLQNLYETPLTPDENSKSRKYLEYFIKWLENWNARSDNTGKLTKKAFSALHHTTNALLEISNYCFTELKANYVLLGKF